MEYFVAAVVIAGFGYFVYTRIKAKKKASGGGTGSGTGGGTRRNVNQRLR